MHFHLSTGNKHFNNSFGKKIYVFDETIIIVISYYIPSQTKVFDDQNLLWMNAESENFITTKK